MKSTSIVFTALLFFTQLNAKTMTTLGVDPSQEHLYQPIFNEQTGENEWRCLGDPSIVLSYDQINDNYCDCPDGSDEPGTNACPYNPERKFYCANEGHIPNYIENYKLNDGVCDYEICCDGSDESITGKCPNKCQEINRQFEEYKTTVLKDVNDSLDLKQQLIEKAAKEKTLVEDSIKAIQQEIEKRSNLEQASINDQEKNEVFEKIHPHIKIVSNKLENQQDTIEKQSGKIKNLESMLSKLVEGYNPNFNDLAVKTAVNKFQEYLSNSENIEIEKHHSSEVEQLKEIIITHMPKEAGHIPSLNTLIHHYYIRAIEFLNPEKQVEQQNIYHNSVDESQQSEEIKKLKAELKVFTNDLNQDYGPNDIFRAVKSTWISTRLDGYHYRLGFLHSIVQDDILIGKFSRYEGNRLYFENGSKCWNGPHRSAVVELICGSDSRLISVSEPEKCEYYFEVVTPIVCNNISEDEILAKFKVNYDSL